MAFEPIWGKNSKTSHPPLRAKWTPGTPLYDPLNIIGGVSREFGVDMAEKFEKNFSNRPLEKVLMVIVRKISKSRPSSSGATLGQNLAYLCRVRLVTPLRPSSHLPCSWRVSGVVGALFFDLKIWVLNWPLFSTRNRLNRNLDLENIGKYSEKVPILKSFPRVLS